MLIRSQDKTELINMNNIEKIIIINESRIVVQTVSNQQWTTIGEYPKGKSLIVLDGIENAYVRFQQRYGSPTKHRDCIYAMPQEEEI